MNNETIFIPPFVYNKDTDSNNRNVNLHITNSPDSILVNGEQTPVRYRDEYPVIPKGIGTHGFVGDSEETATNQSSTSEGLYPAESQDVLFHHYIRHHPGEDINDFPYIVHGDGSYNSVINDKHGVAWKSRQGVQLLWEQFFSKYTITELEWNTEQYYYHYLFGKYLTSFIIDFLPLFAQHDNGSQINIIDIDNAQGGFYYLSGATGADIEKEDIIEFDNENGINFLNAKNLLLSPGISDRFESIRNDLVKFSSQVPDISFQQLFLGSDYTETWFYFDSICETNSLEKTWDLFMDASDLEQRRHSAFLWILREVIRMLDKLQDSGISQSNRIITLINGEEAAVKNMKSINFSTPSNASDIDTITDNQLAQGYIETYRTYQDINGKYAGQQNSVVTNTTSSIKSQSTIMTTILKQMEGLIEDIFNR